MLRLVLVSAIVLAAGTAQAQRLPGLYAEAGGPTGLYAVGLDQLLLRSEDDARRLSLKAGVSVRDDDSFPLAFGTDRADIEERVLNVPVGAVASFSLGDPLGVAARFEVGAGYVLVRRNGLAYTGNRGAPAEEWKRETRLFAPPFAETAVRAEIGSRLSVRAGLTFGGDSSDLVSRHHTRAVVGSSIAL